MSGDVTYQALDRLSYLPHRTALKNGNAIAGQFYYDVYFTGGSLDSVNITNSTINGIPGSSIVTLNGVQTLTNKTLTTPVISSILNSGTLTLPTSTDTLVGRATTDTFTNKSISASSNTITNLTTGTFAANVVDNDSTLAANSSTRLPTQQAVKGYVDNNLNGLSWKQAVRVATTANGTLATAFANGQTIDGVVLATGNRILIKNQTTQTDNGIYTVNASGTPTRATDSDTGTELISATVLITAGTVNADTQWTCTNDTITLGVTNIAFAQIAGAGTYTNGTGLTLSGNSFSITTNGVTNALLAQMPTLTIKGNNTGGTANATDLTIPQVAALFSAPQVTVYTSGSSTYTTPTNAKYLIVEGVGGGGGGAGAGPSTSTNGGNGVATTFGTALLTGNSGLGGSTSSATTQAGGTATGGDDNQPGGNAIGANGAAQTYGGDGGNSYYGGAGGGGGPAGVNGVNAAANTGSGGGGGGSGVSGNTGGGGTSGGRFWKLISSPLASYAYSVGTAGAGGVAGTGGGAGGNGAAGKIIVTAYFQ